ncbi:MAG: PEP-CTERM sorting domain-containing protein [Acidobacteria bacterium]|nr:PEP-CTERM sorting domain-containing protein [Acidobacteriota bacterium]
MTASSRSLLPALAAATLLLVGATLGIAGPMAYVVTGVNGTDLALLDLGTGNTTSIGSFTDSGIRGLALSPGGTLYAGGQVAFYSVNTTTAATTLIASPLAVLEDMDFDGNNLLASSTVIVYDVNTTTGAETFIGSGITNYYGFAVIDSTTAYVTYFDTLLADRALGILNHSTSAITPIGALGAALTTGHIITGLDIASDGNLYGVSTAGDVLRIDTSTGLATLIAQTQLNFRALAAIPDAGVPEPSTVALCALGLGTLLLRKRA